MNKQSSGLWCSEYPGCLQIPMNLLWSQRAGMRNHWLWMALLPQGQVMANVQHVTSSSGVSAAFFFFFFYSTSWSIASEWKNNSDWVFGLVLSAKIPSPIQTQEVKCARRMRSRGDDRTVLVTDGTTRQRGNLDEWRDVHEQSWLFRMDLNRTKGVQVLRDACLFFNSRIEANTIRSSFSNRPSSACQLAVGNSFMHAGKN